MLVLTLFQNIRCSLQLIRVFLIIVFLLVSSQLLGLVQIHLYDQINMGATIHITKIVFSLSMWVFFFSKISFIGNTIMLFTCTISIVYSCGEKNIYGQRSFNDINCYSSCIETILPIFSFFRDFAFQKNNINFVHRDDDSTKLTSN